MKHSTSLHRYVFFLLMLLASACSAIPSRPRSGTVIYYAPASSTAVTSDSLSTAGQVLQERFNEVLKGKAIVSVEEKRLRVELTRADDLGLTGQLTTEIIAIGFWGYTPGDPMPPVAGVECPLTDGDIAGARATISEYKEWQVDIELTAAGAKKLADYAKADGGEYLTIMIVQDETVVTAPINTPLLNGPISISGVFDEQETKILAAKLNSGRLPFQLEIVEWE